MQFPTPYYNILTIPTGKTTGHRIEIDGVRGAIFEYDDTNALVGSWATALTNGTDRYGNTYQSPGIFLYDRVGSVMMGFNSGTMTFGPLFNQALDGTLTDAAGIFQIQGAQTNVSDTPPFFRMRSANATGDAIPRVEAVSALMVDGGLAPPNPANNANFEVFKHFSFHGSGGTLWSAGGTGITPGFKLIADSNMMEITGRFTVPSGGAVAGQQMCQPTAAAYQPARVQSVPARITSGANANSTVWCFYDTTGTLFFAGPATLLAAGDVFEIATHRIDLAAT